MKNNEIPLKQKTIKGFLWGGIANGIQQVFALLFGIVLGRILMPEDMGIVGILTIFSAVSAAFMESGFVSALIIKKNITQDDYNAVHWLCIAIGATLYLLLFFAAPLIADFYEIPILATAARVSFLNFFISSFGIAHSAYLNRNLLLRERALSTTAAVFISGICGVTTAFYGLGYWSLIIQNLTYCIVTSSGFFYYSGFRPTLHFNFKPIQSMFRYSSKLLLTNVFINVNNNFLTSILGKFFPTAIVGQFNQANKWNLMGQTFILSINNSLIQPLMTEISQNDGSRQVRVFRKLLSFVSFITFPLMFGLSFVSNEFIIILIGQKWLVAADYLRIVAFGGAFAVASNVFANYNLSQGRSTIYMWNIICFGLLQIALFFLLKSYSIIYLLYAYTGLQIIWLNTWYYICRHKLQYHYYFLFKDVYLFAVTATLSLFITNLWASHIDHIYLRFVAKAAGLVSIYLFLLFITKSDILSEVISFLKEKISKKEKNTK
ncbi:lipopolysaccharide biosynthesis protein [Sphingobacterium sp. SGR-19]|uniref:lipopolysaccharide biosynthesis protein n=1 Tax=Sphingobacterium sp. SGR-19 TaxID=2710886 RepID=UPI0013EC7557|nr:lipopolysaccharide biosynthesis protein [Sphingobacterium sp. SGR-19]NGM65749.1 lipopolysaccharide biosynthesis protein [Sphingobacterium sp. SGR-19]